MNSCGFWYGLVVVCHDGLKMVIVKMKGKTTDRPSDQHRDRQREQLNG